jgi:DNA-directed RNA polymerase specialized sigma24 family protein
MKTEWILTREAFDNLLSWLAPDRDEGGRKYEEIRSRLIRFFTCRGCCCPEDLADETITRVIKAMESKAAEYKGEPIAFFYAVAKKVYLEKGRVRPLRSEDLPVFAGSDREGELDCLERCMSRISASCRELISRYHQQEGSEKILARQQLARELGLEMNALRIQACRIRKILRDCVSDCIASKAA